MTSIITPKLNQILKQRKMTQSELSILTGIPQGTISRFDKNSRFEISHLYAISKALGIRIEDLFEISKNEEE
ncbi:helix-turn-helix domain-containing protein [Brevibacillus laterosporus]|uniref:Transcriptional regulator n=1 Tax=Brevibacillus laterosporus TaxID=1465 RepID=A0AAP8U730_BRELA|nr:helix-turn-helix transcriptional regulator [Brevibacillus laterosporus]MBG9776159.1 transcriptional regulator [Brevibacillus laterosporus]MED1665728.1 helix-turn-helix transcriptional regulator [Brevibacillus laterosporus]MED1667183.1 helix-turn-helix transcriptional regulator [Brevibacillus laterosporus]MED1719749.1 helix-turn-helix transcriptional regulator [Brevibacillus laterosporus]PPB12868.1 transcriptional regulator [Brevibacillus laterosporus]